MRPVSYTHLDVYKRQASIGAWPPEEKSDAYDLMLPGQMLPTVTRWTVREGSVVTIGANHNEMCIRDRSKHADFRTAEGMPQYQEYCKAEQYICLLYTSRCV